ncbi:hypothetical protein RRSWK_03787 [Rhodopirellula sp. SWK7]|nr:hypothetical protein RRSWK_03787 [Rhodopirellula sp. SWK7]
MCLCCIGFVRHWFRAALVSTAAIHLGDYPMATVLSLEHLKF